MVSNGRRAFRCSKAYATERSCIQRKYLPMAWCEGLVLSRLLERLSLAAEEPSALLKGEVGHLRALLEAALTQLPVDTASAFEVADGVRRILKRFTLRLGESGQVQIAMEVDVTWLFTVAEDAPGPAAPEIILVNCGRAALRQAEHAKRLETRRGPMADAAREGVFDIADDAWRFIEHLFERVDLRFASGTLSARMLLNGYLCLVATEGAWPHVPERFGDPADFRNAWKRIVYEGAWDDAVHILNVHFPGTITDKHVTRLSSSKFNRNSRPVAHRRLGFGAVETGRYLNELDGLSAAFPGSAAVKRDVSILRDVLNGHGRKATAERWKVSLKVVYEAVGKLRTRGVESFRPAPTRAGRSVKKLHKLNDDQTRSVKLVASTGLDPDDHSAILSLAKLVAWTERVHGVRFHPQGMRQLLKREGVRMPSTIRDRLWPSSAQIQG